MISVHHSPPKLCGHGCREESLLPIGGPLGPEQPTCSPVPSHPLEKDGEFTVYAPSSSNFKCVTSLRPSG